MGKYTDNISMLVHGEPGAGKSWLGQTAPAPRLILDAEGGARSPRKVGPSGKAIRVKQVIWDPTKDAPPEPGDWESCQVFCRDFNTVKRSYEWLNSGKHPFHSVIMDSITEVQKRCKDAISGGEAPSEREWGFLLVQMEQLIRNFRDLTFHPSNPLDAVVILALTISRNGGKSRPAVQGALGTSLPGYVDLEGYLAAFPNEETGELERRMLINPHVLFEAKDRTHVLTEQYGQSITNPDIERMLEIINEEETI